MQVGRYTKKFMVHNIAKYNFKNQEYSPQNISPHCESACSLTALILVDWKHGIYKLTINNQG